MNGVVLNWPRDERFTNGAGHPDQPVLYTAAFFAELFAIHFAANWVAWFTEHDPGALDHGMAESFDTETYRAFPKLRTEPCLSSLIPRRSGMLGSAPALRRQSSRCQAGG